MLQHKFWMSAFAGSTLLVGMTGCLPSTEHHQTQVQAASDVKITMEEGKAIVGTPEKTAPDADAEESQPAADSEN